MSHYSSPPSDRLDLLYRLSQTFNSSLDLAEVLNRVMDEVIAVLKAERGFVMLFDTQGQLQFHVARGIDQQTIDDPAFQVSRSIVENVSVQGKSILTSDAQSDVRFSMRQSVKVLGLRAILCVPLLLKGKIVGVIYVDNRVHVGNFSRSDLELLSAIASNAAIAIENARLYQLAVEKGRLERELQMAYQVQSSLLPEAPPEIPGWEFVTFWKPARQVAGDYYDFLLHEDGSIGLIIADVSDKGMPAALYMGLVRTIVRTSMHRCTSLVEGISKANQLVVSDSSNGMFVTLFYAKLQPDSGVVKYVNAGHNPPVHYRQQANKGQGGLFELSRTGIALGVLSDAQYEERTLKLDTNDFILLYTDGVPDATNAGGEFFGMERLKRLLHSIHSYPAIKIEQSLEKELIEFSGAVESADDITLMVAKRV